jgi:hypothetical protein
VPEIRRQVVDLTLNGSGIRDTARAAYRQRWVELYEELAEAEQWNGPAYAAQG